MEVDRPEWDGCERRRDGADDVVPAQGYYANAVLLVGVDIDPIPGPNRSGGEPAGVIDPIWTTGAIVEIDQGEGILGIDGLAGGMEGLKQDNREDYGQQGFGVHESVYDGKVRRN